MCDTSKNGKHFRRFFTPTTVPRTSAFDNIAIAPKVNTNGRSFLIMFLQLLKRLVTILVLLTTTTQFWLKQRVLFLSTCTVTAFRRMSKHRFVCCVGYWSGVMFGCCRWLLLLFVLLGWVLLLLLSENTAAVFFDGEPNHSVTLLPFKLLFKTDNTKQSNLPTINSSHYN